MLKFPLLQALMQHAARLICVRIHHGSTEVLRSCRVFPIAMEAHCTNLRARGRVGAFDMAPILRRYLFAYSKENTTMHASGPFEVKLTPQPAAPGIEPANLGRQTISKQFQGDLDATSLGEMLSAMGN